MSGRPSWETHAATGKRFFRYRHDGQIGYQLEDGTRLTQRQFDELTGNRDIREVPRDTQSTFFSLFPREESQEMSQGPLLGASRNYAVHQETRRDTARLPQDPLHGASQGYAVRREAQRGRAGPDQDPSYTSSGQTSHAYPGDHANQRPAERNTSTPSQSAATKDVTRPPHHALPSRLSRLCTSLVNIGLDDYSRLELFVLKNNSILSQSEIDSLLSQAREEQDQGREANMQTFVHHALLLRRCKALDVKGRTVFFKQLGDRNSGTRTEFLNDVRKVCTYMKSSTRPLAPTPQSSNTQSQGRGLPLEYQAGAQASRHSSERTIEMAAQSRQSAVVITPEDPRAPLAHYQPSAPETQQQVHRVQTSDGTEMFIDRLGYVVPTASIGRESNHHGASYDTYGMTESTAKTSISEAPPRVIRSRDTRLVGSEDPASHVEGANRAQKALPLETGMFSSYGDMMPTLHDAKTGTGQKIEGTEGDVETLDPRYRKRPDAGAFFVRGRVFSLLWHEPAGNRNSDLTTAVKFTRGRYGEEIYSHIKQMVVVKEGHGACLCLPISTYGGRGVTKPGFSKVDRQAHSVIYMSDTEPEILPGESDMTKIPIKVDKASSDQKLPPMSRINFSKVHAVIWNVKVMNVGTVARESMPALVTYWRQALE